jgi:hypothetical protein
LFKSLLKIEHHVATKQVKSFQHFKQKIVFAKAHTYTCVHQTL